MGNWGVGELKAKTTPSVPLPQVKGSIDRKIPAHEGHRKLVEAGSSAGEEGKKKQPKMCFVSQ